MVRSLQERCRPQDQISRGRGVALATALMLGVFLLILGMAFLTFIERDIFFASHQAASQDAYFLARSGMEYFRATGLPANPGDAAQTIQIPIGNPQRVAVIQRPLSGDLIVTGRVYGALGIVRAERTLVAPGGSLANWYER